MHNDARRGHGSRSKSDAATSRRAGGHAPSKDSHPPVFNNSILASPHVYCTCPRQKRKPGVIARHCSLNSFKTLLQVKRLKRALQTLVASCVSCVALAAEEYEAERIERCGCHDSCTMLSCTLLLLLTCYSNYGVPAHCQGKQLHAVLCLFRAGPRQFGCRSPDLMCHSYRRQYADFAVALQKVMFTCVQAARTASIASTTV